MSEAKEKILSDAIKTTFEYSYEIIKLKRIITVMSYVIIALIVGYFI